MAAGNLELYGRPHFTDEANLGALLGNKGVSGFVGVNTLVGFMG